MTVLGHNGLLRLPRRILSEVENAAHAAWPVEACGLLVGRRLEIGNDAFVLWDVVRWVPARNVVGERTPDRFEIDPQVIFDTQRALRAAEAETGSGAEAAMDIIGHVHSHPNGACDPSPIDAAGAYEPHHAWLIVGVQGGETETGPTTTCATTTCIRAWTPAPTPNGFAALGLEITE